MCIRDRGKEECHANKLALPDGQGYAAATLSPPPQQSNQSPAALSSDFWTPLQGTVAIHTEASDEQHCVLLADTEDPTMPALVKDTRDTLSSCGVYKVLGSCGMVYIGTTKCSVNTHISEQKQHCHLS